MIDDKMFTFIHKKTTPIKNYKDELIYCTDYSIETNRRRNILKARSELESKILYFYKNDLVFYQSNTIGEIVRNYISWCITNSGN